MKGGRVCYLFCFFYQTLHSYKLPLPRRHLLHRFHSGRSTTPAHASNSNYSLYIVVVLRFSREIDLVEEGEGCPDLLVVLQATPYHQ